ncbi:LacI family DNA-binding transcriptional regulator [Psychromicrobium xiongbiense]|uniref:LacI family DNA-binding transcriptional regulator n=1 Tax=Psychromicrobium xiongbiense TaxID=3051184 RepID=UPI00255738F4|nr:LacI family DNA-binding transcriptional regulator [Psychromicrobium sp. YIM S02556]
MARKATSNDVARHAGVSRSAVSFVMNGRADGNIAKDKQERILAAAKALNYTPNAVARSLQSQRTHTIGVVTDSIAGGPFAGKLLQGASTTAFRAGYLLLVIDTQQDSARADSAVSTLVNRQVDALMFATMSLREHTQPPVHSEIPVVLANSFDPQGKLRSIIPDEVSGGRAAAKILIDAGHRRIAYLAGTNELVATERRTQGFLAAMTDAGIEPTAIVPTGWETNAGFAATLRLLSTSNGEVRPERPSGIVCANDRVALGAMLACGQLGLRVPRDVSLVGYDDDEPLARTTVPGLTTVALPHREMGEQAAALLLEDLARASAGSPETPDAGHAAAVDDASQVAPLLLPCPVVTRGSVAAPLF